MHGIPYQSWWLVLADEQEREGRLRLRGQPGSRGDSWGLSEAPTPRAGVSGNPSRPPHLCTERGGQGQAWAPRLAWP